MVLSSWGVIRLPDLADLALPLELDLGVVLVLAIAASGKIAAEEVKINAEADLKW